MTARLTTPIAVFAAVAALSCSNPVSLPTEDPIAEGHIIEKDTETFPLPSVLVQEGPEDDCGVWVGFRSETEVVLRSTGERIGFEEILVGDSIRLWSTSLLDSCPGRTIATAVEIIR